MSTTLVARHRVDRAEWDALVTVHPDGWVWHLSDWVDYLVASGREDRSTALMVDGELDGIAVWCGPVPTDDPLPAPLWPGRPPMAGPYRKEPRPLKGGERDGFYTRVVDLSRPNAMLWRDMRRSYHALIHRAEEQYRVGWSTVGTLRSLYDAQPERPQLTDGQWTCVERLAADGKFVVLSVWDDTGRVAGAIGIYFWRGRAYYGHGRSRDRNVNHLLHWRAMQWLPQRGVRWYEIGWEARPEDDAKAQAIAFHKAGFGGERWWIEVLP